RRARRGLFLPALHESAALTFQYRGLDNVMRTPRLEFAPPPRQVDPTRAQYAIALDPGARIELAVTVSASVGAAPRARSLGWDDAGARRRAVVHRRRGEA